MTRMKWIGIGIVVVALIAGAAWISDRNEANALTPYRLADVQRGDIEETVSATGTLTAVQTVAVGTRVSGQVIELHADFNDEVRAGQLLARIDPTLQEQQVRNAVANLERARAELRRMQQEFDRNRTLFEQQVITESEFSQIEYSYAVAQSSVTSAEVNLEQARQNLAYTEIYAPIDGVVVERNAEVGMTVAASLSAPQLYLLANDLTELEILASVDEADIGQIKPGQRVRFSVQAYREEQFEGTVRQVRLQSTTSENVVNYTVVVRVSNPDMRLLPGMTAVVDFIVRSAEDVYTVANAALRFTPSEEMLAQVGDSALVPPGGREITPEMRTRIAERAASGAASGAAARTAARGGGRGGGFATLWYLRDGRPAVTRVRTGITDGVQTEITGPDIEAGMQVISGLNTAGGTPQQQNRNPFQQQNGGFGGGPPGGFRGGPGFGG